MQDAPAGEMPSPSEMQGGIILQRHGRVRQHGTRILLKQVGPGCHAVPPEACFPVPAVSVRRGPRNLVQPVPAAATPSPTATISAGLIDSSPPPPRHAGFRHLDSTARLTHRLPPCSTPCGELRRVGAAGGVCEGGAGPPNPAV
jgi:hypothetical protein